MPEGNSGGKLVDDRSRIGWDSGRIMLRMAYFRHACWSRIAGGGNNASISMGMAGQVRNAPRIRLLDNVDLNSAWVKWCPPWRVCSVVQLF